MMVSNFIGVSFIDEKALEEISSEYYRGLSWILHYYNEKILSWSWLFPYHYVPFASDLYKYMK